MAQFLTDVLHDITKDWYKSQWELNPSYGSPVTEQQLFIDDLLCINGKKMSELSR